ncbi:hypothetical protein WJX72_009833 [[Myrmecia] bisecta]|uniref:Uncharacterized protein n=1 Tax=[Myrmecia] bisecta TaxID=41462 RepID=A0AAW1P7C2_9CHLO
MRWLYLCCAVGFAIAAPQHTGASSSMPAALGAILSPPSHHKFDPWQPLPTFAQGSPMPALKARCGDTLSFTWSGQTRRSVMLVPDGTCLSDFTERKELGVVELFPAATSGNLTVDLDEPGTFYFTDPPFCRNLVLEVIVTCQTPVSRGQFFGTEGTTAYDLAKFSGGGQAGGQAKQIASLPSSQTPAIPHGVARPLPSTEPQPEQRVRIDDGSLSSSHTVPASQVSADRPQTADNSIVTQPQLFSTAATAPGKLFQAASRPSGAGLISDSTLGIARKAKLPSVDPAHAHAVQPATWEGARPVASQGAERLVRGNQPYTTEQQASALGRKGMQQGKTTLFSSQ